ncbi:hypothetical protein AX774_g6764 [Zancudomyces culisetae]|uniref:Uncharacterized protein n=1 Tax=Zancudomyces culisetae TaxID=1213189 RepID=A0A1R1PFX0_ZANCU|nr:hypothetical protein AX774_g6764 [Zancudomyces culisetae]|eukprot:OMH79819.1 hypothetical protein AX774_g6764 [Zancudomyces culisetae]
MYQHFYLNSSNIRLLLLKHPTKCCRWILLSIDIDLICALCVSLIFISSIISSSFVLTSLVRRSSASKNVFSLFAVSPSPPLCRCTCILPFSEIPLLTRDVICSLDEVGLVEFHLDALKLLNNEAVLAPEPRYSCLLSPLLPFFVDPAFPPDVIALVRDSTRGSIDIGTNCILPESSL